LAGLAASRVALNADGGKGNIAAEEAEAKVADAAATPEEATQSE
jgi:hypothetical protein